MSALTPVAVGEVQRIISGGPRALSVIEQSIASSHGEVAADIFQIGLESSIEAFEHAVGWGATLHALVDPRIGGGGLGARVADLVAERGSIAVYGGGAEQAWMHAKSFHFTGVDGQPRSWLTNLSLIQDTYARSELSLLVGGEAAAAAREVTRATIEGNPRRMHAAIDAARDAGVLVNDPIVGRRELTAGIDEVLRGSESDLLVITKGIEDVHASAAIADARRAGREVQVFVRDLARRDATMLGEAGVDVRVMSGGPKPRINAFFSGDRAVVGSAFLWDPMTGPAELATSRDVGVLLAGDAARRVRTAATELVLAQSRLDPAAMLLDQGRLLEHI